MMTDAAPSTLVPATIVRNANPLAWFVTSAANIDRYRTTRRMSNTASTT